MKIYTGFVTTNYFFFKYTICYNWKITLKLQSTVLLNVINCDPQYVVKHVFVIK